MRDVLIVRLDAPLLSFGGVAVDNRRPTQEFPSLSLVTGLLGNALGYDHRDPRSLQRLQERVQYAARRDRPGQRLSDFHTVDLGQDHLVATGWTTRGEPELRGGASSDTTHIRVREYWADSVYTLALTLQPADEPPDLSRIERALREPERPLFVGRKCCLPAAPLLVRRCTAATLRGALEAEPRIARARWSDPQGAPEALAAWVPGDESARGSEREIAVTDERDWENQIVVGRRVVLHTTVNPPEATDGR
jgi:CRISPR system Cascade subunit CasD